MSQAARKNFDLAVYLVTDRERCLGRDLRDIVSLAVEGGCTMVQLREKDADTGEFVALARDLMTVLRDTQVPLIIDDRVDIALAVGASGVHVGQKDMNVSDVRRLMGPDAIVGLTVHSEELARKAADLDIDYLGAGPVFPTKTKKNAAPALGMDGLARICRATHHRLVAIGSLTADKAADAVRAGAEGVAVVSAICSAPSPRLAAVEIAAAVRRVYKGG
ncbi:MAG: thiamine phosphate synthase [Desulfovibrio sp.]|uniref:thiamine phosphate synthase n=1 Tax=Desulfovibrio sp. 7SRBS1 TaxID=3378064 RepID=UPI003B3DA382